MLLGALLALPGAAAPQAVWSTADAAVAGARDGRYAAGAPTDRIGRLGLLDGDARYFAGDAAADRWAAAEPNLPIVSGMSLATAAGSRAEVRIGSLTVTLDGDTQADFFRIDATALEIGVARGAVALTVTAYSPAERFELEAGPVRLAARAPGTYILRFDAEQRAAAKVAHGNAELKAGVATLPLIAGQQARIEPGAALSYRREPLVWDDFDDWVQRRETESAAAGGMPYVSPEMTGAEVLADQGSWQQDPALGAVWYPTAVPRDWEPDRDGRWADAAPGPVWIAAAPWGFVTGHYGRWQRVDGRWGWLPGAYRTRPVAVAPQRPPSLPGRGEPRRPAPVLPAPGLTPPDLRVPSFPAPGHAVPDGRRPPIAQMPAAPPRIMPQQPVPLAPIAPGVGSYPTPPRDFATPPRRFPTPSRDFPTPPRSYPQQPRFDPPARGLSPATPPGTQIRPQAGPRASQWRPASR
ncbi:MAG: DUF6600 domain-containing protein [Lautropia sp.]